MAKGGFYQFGIQLPVYKYLRCADGIVTALPFGVLASAGLIKVDFIVKPDLAVIHLS